MKHLSWLQSFFLFSFGLILILLLHQGQNNLFALSEITGSGSIIISEIMYDVPGTDEGHEWIEIQNLSTENIDLSQWKLYENNVNHSLKSFTGSFDISPADFAIITTSGASFQADYPETGSGTILESSFSLSNSGESFSLRDGNNKDITSLFYSSAAGANGNGKTLERDTDGFFKESKILKGTPFQKNSIQNYNEQSNTNNTQSENTNENQQENQNAIGNNNSTPDGTGNGTNENTNQDNNENSNNSPNQNNNTNSSIHINPGDIIINEIYPAPTKGENEWIEIFNTTDMQINLTKITIEDATLKKVKLTGLMDPKSYMVLDPSPLSLNNSGEVLILKDENGITLDEVRYGDKSLESDILEEPKTKQSLARYPNGKDTNINKADFKHFGTPTKGQENSINNHAPQAVITLQYPYKIVGKAPMSVNVTGEDSYDIDGDTLVYIWQYGDGFSSIVKNPLAHKYQKEGFYTLSLTVFDSFGLSSRTEQVIEVLANTEGVEIKTELTEETKQKCISQKQEGDILISEFFPNPDTKKGESEFIELWNAGESEINLCGWKLDDIENGGSKPFIFKEDIILESDEYVVIENKQSKIALNNDKDEVHLINPENVIQEKISYEDAPKSQSYARILNEDITQNLLNFKEISNDLEMENNLKKIKDREFKNFRLIYQAYAEPEIKKPEKLKTFVWEWIDPTPGVINKLKEKTPINMNIKINEVLPDPQEKDNENEFIELKNEANEDQDISLWSIKDESGKKYIFPENTKIPANGFIGIMSKISHISLANKEDTIYLIDKEKRIVDELSYEGASKGKSYSRFKNEEKTSSWIWVSPTFEKENSMEEIKKILEKSEVTEESVYSGTLLISEIFVKSSASEKTVPWIEIVNTSDQIIDIANMYVENSKKQVRVLYENTLISPYEYKTFEISEAMMNLGSKDTLTFYDPIGKIIDSVEYQKALVGKSFVQEEITHTMLLTDFPTPGSSNIKIELFSSNKDKDADGILDEEEIKLQTDIHSWDTDKDGLSDGFEVMIHSNPLFMDENTEKKEQYKKYLADFFLIHLKENKKSWSLTGKSLPYGTITVYVKNKEGKVVFTEKDVISKTGSFTITVKPDVSLSADDYFVSAFIKDQKGFISQESRIIEIHIPQNIAGKKTAKKSDKNEEKLSNISLSSSQNIVFAADTEHLQFQKTKSIQSEKVLMDIKKWLFWIVCIGLLLLILGRKAMTSFYKKE